MHKTYQKHRFLINTTILVFVQLTARINRMERRVALKARRSTTKDDFDVEGESGKSKANEQKR